MLGCFQTNCVPICTYMYVNDMGIFLTLAVVCPAIEVANSHLNSTSLRFGVHVEVVCDEGFTIEGPNVLQCTETGEWNIEAPKCVLKRK